MCGYREAGPAYRQITSLFLICLAILRLASISSCPSGHGGWAGSHIRSDLEAQLIMKCLLETLVVTPQERPD